MPRSTSTRLTLANAALLAASFAVLIFLVTLLADRFMVSHVQENVEAELHILEAELKVDGSRGVAALINLRLQNRTLNHFRVYRLESAEGALLAGNMATWPMQAGAAGQFFRMPSTMYPGETEVVLLWSALPDGNRLLVGLDLIEVAQVRRDIRHAAFWSLGIMMLVALSGGFLLTRAAMRPVEGIRAAAQRIMGGDLRHRIPSRPNGDEFDRLSGTLNSMLDRINNLIASVKGATDNIAHDLRSPLTRHRARLEAALRNPPLPEEVPALLERSIADLDQVLSTFQSLLRIASVESGLLKQEFTDCDMGQLIKDAADYIEPLVEQKHQQLTVHVDEGAPLRGHRHLLFQLLINLLDNSVKYGPVGSAITLAAVPKGTGWELSVLDFGPGIPEDQRERVFERLYRLDASRHTPGLGLGLSLVKAIVQLHQGSVSIRDNSPGTLFSVTLPFT